MLLTRWIKNLADRLFASLQRSRALAPRTSRNRRRSSAVSAWVSVQRAEDRVLLAFAAGDLALLVTAESDSNSPANVVEINTTTAGQSAIQTIAIPATGTDAFRMSASATSTGYVALSNDRTLLTFTGANSTDTSANVNTLHPRGVFTVDNPGTVVKQTTYTGTSSNQTRGATSLNNTNWFIGDQGGFYSNGTSAASPTGNIRSVKSFGGTAYAFTASASIPPVGIISAPTGGSYTALAGLGNGATSMQDFYMVRSGDHGSTYDMLYVLSATSATVSSIAKFSLVDTNANSVLGDVGDLWTANGTYTTNFGGFGLAAADAGAGEVLYVSSGTGASTANSVRKVTDDAGYNTTINVTTANNVTLYTTAAGTIIKGLDFAPQSAPTISANTGLTLNEAATATIDNTRLAATDVEDTAANLTFTVGTAPIHGALKLNGTTLTSGQTFTQADVNNSLVTYAHDGGETTSDSFTFTVKDSQMASTALQTFNITVTPMNDAPSLTTNAGLSGVVLSTTTTITSSFLLVGDVDNTASQITYTVGTAPTGLLKKSGTTLNATDTFTQDDINNSLITYTAPASGTTDSFTFTVSDGAGGSIGSTTFNITLSAGNTAPTVAANTGLTLNEAATATITTAKLQVTDTEQSAASLTYTVGTAPINGALKKSGTTLNASETFTQADIDNSLITYVHNGGETTSDSFTFTVSDGSGGSIGLTTFNITVTPVDDAPLLPTNAGLTVVEGAAATMIDNTKLLVSDVDNTAAQIVFTVTTIPTGGTLAKNGTALAVNDTFTQTDINNSLITYAHAGGESATDNFHFTVSDGAGGSIDDTTFTITVTGINDDPTVAINRTLTLNPGQSVAISNAILLVSDPDKTAAQLAYTVTTGPTKGTITKNGIAITTLTQADLNAGDTLAAAIRYTATTGVAGDTDTIVLSLTDGTSTPISVTINISIVAAAAPASYTGSYSQSFNNLLPTSIPGNNSSLPAAMILPQGWLASETGTNSSNSVRFDNGTQSTGDSYFYGAADSNERALGTQSSGSNAPVRVGAAFTNNSGVTITSLNVSYTGELWRNGVNGTVNTLTFDYSTNATSLTTGTYTAVPALHFVAPDDVVTGIKDGNLATNQSAVSGTISGLSWEAGTTIYIRWTDVDNTGNDDGLAIDGVSITTANSAPTALASSVTTNEDTARTFAASDFLFADADGDSLVSIVVSGLILASGDTLTVDQGSGAVAVTNGMTITAAEIGSLIYTPAANGSGSARSTLDFKVNDAGGNGTVAATMSINVTAVNDVPVAQASSVTTNEDTAKTFSVSDFLFTDVESDSLVSITISNLTLASVDTLTVDQGSGAVAVTNGMTITAAEIGSLIYTPAANANGSARSTFDFKVNDSGLGTVAATMTINVTAVNDVPAANTSSVTTNEDTAKTFAVSDFLFTDVEGNSLVSITVSNLTLVSGDTLTVDQGSGSVAVTNGMTITAAQIATLIYTPTSNANGSARSTFDFKVNDSGLGTVAATMTINVTAVDDGPVIGAFDTTVAYTANGAGTLLDTNATVADVDTARFNGGVLTVSLTANAEVNDRLGIRQVTRLIGVSGSNVTFRGTTIGSLAGGVGTANLVITFNGNATVSAVQTVLRNVTYRSVSATPSTAPRTVQITLTDGVGGTSNLPTKTINVAVPASPLDSAQSAPSLALNQPGSTTADSFSGADSKAGSTSFVAPPAAAVSTDHAPNGEDLLSFLDEGDVLSGRRKRRRTL